MSRASRTLAQPPRGHCVVVTGGVVDVVKVLVMLVEVEVEVKVSSSLSDDVVCLFEELVVVVKSPVDGGGKIGTLHDSPAQPEKQAHIPRWQVPLRQLVGEHFGWKLYVRSPVPYTTGSLP